MRSSTGSEAFEVAGPGSFAVGLVDRLTARELSRLEESTTGSRSRYVAARGTLPGGVTSSFQMQDPWPVYLETGSGSRVVDVDGVSRLDLHNGFGAVLQGHAHPRLTEEIARRAAAGTHLGATGDDALVVAGELRARWGLPCWRFATTGSEATADAVRLARAATGRAVVVKMFGAYHGHHDSVLVSIGDDDGGAAPDALPSVPAGLGLPAGTTADTVAVPFNDAAALEGRLEALAAQGRPAACVIVEPIFGMGVLVPAPGYLERLRELCTAAGALLVFDEVKSGLAVGPAGWTGRSGVRPDLVTVGKALGGGLPVSAVGADAAVMALVADRRVVQVGTFNGNALAMAVARRNLTEVLTPAAHHQLDRRGQRLLDGARALMTDSGLGGHGASAGARGFLSLVPGAATSHRDVARAHPPDISRLAWLYLMNRGVFTTPARPLQWMVGLAHTERDVDDYLAVVADLVAELAA